MIDMRMKLLLPLLLATAACATGPDYITPQAPTAGQGAFVTKVPATATNSPVDGSWWRIYEDPALNDLVERALAANTDLRVAVANLKAAEAVLGETRNARLPQTTLSGQATYGRTQPPLFLPDNRFTALGGVQLAYEVDLFGRVSRSIEAARADAEADAFAEGAVRVRVVSDVTNA